jgi:DNA-binding response OmpR family regulator
MREILLLEDDRSLRALIAERLTREGYSVDEFYDGRKALLALSHKHYDLLLLDINVPTLSGYSLLKRVRAAHNQTPAIVISAHGDMDSQDEGYALGCDDFLRKPFGLKELLWRVEAIFSHTDKPPQKPADDRIALSHPYSYCPATQSLYHQNSALSLTPKERKLIALLVSRRGRLVPSETILAEVWGAKGRIEQLRAAIYKLRKKGLGELIISQKGMGYQID